MHLFQLIGRELQLSLSRIIVFATLSGISNALIVAMVNSAAQVASMGTVDFWIASTFVISLLLFIWSQRFLLATTTTEVEATVGRLRMRLLDDLRHSELSSIEAIGRSEIYSNITKETTTLTQAATMMVVAAQALVLIFFVSIYVAYLSLVAFGMSAFIIVIIVLLYLSRGGRVGEEMRESLRWENRLFERLTDLLEGFKEVRLNRLRSDDLFKDTTEVSNTSVEIKTRSQIGSLQHSVFSQAAFYMMLGAIVLVVPTISNTLGDSMVKTTTALLFIVGSISSVVQSIPILSAANAAAENIVQLQEHLRASAVRAAAPLLPTSRHFSRIELRGVQFDFLDKQSESIFRIGPLDFQLDAGELVFITGGNGSGKSTFMKVLTSLYQPSAGQIILDGGRVVGSNRESYRGLFSAVFSDYHLFRRLYGIPNADPAEIDALLAKFQLTGKTGLIDGEFATLDLSAGQRKRLALVVALLEKRPILVLDEWTADQDPEFRRKFYDELLPELQETGKTVVAVTHDDRFLKEVKIPIRQLRMDDGRFV